MKKPVSLLLLTLTVSFGSCDLYLQDEYQEQYFVESYLIAGKPLPVVRLSTTVAFEQFYDPLVAGVEGARVSIYRLDEDGIRQTGYTYRASSRGIYEPVNRVAQIHGRNTYELEITFPGSQDVISAFTTVPDTFSIQEVITDTTIYQSPQQLMARFTPSYYPGRQNYFIFSTRSLEPEKYGLTPFWKYTGEDNGSLHQISSGIVHQDNYEIGDDGTLTLRYPWIGIAYYGPNEIITFAIDENVYDFFRSQATQMGGTTLSPGEIQNIIYNIEGGIGLFGSMAGAGLSVYVAPG